MFRMPSRKSPRSQRAKGFSLIEMLFVLAVIGILSGIAIPSFMGQRRRARVIGDAISNAKVLQMALESRKAETGTYGVPLNVYGWNADGTRPAPAVDPAPTFQPAGNGRMNYTVQIDAIGVAYVLDVTDPAMANGLAYRTNQTGQELARMQ